MSAATLALPVLGDGFPSELVSAVGARLRQNQRVRRSLPVWGRISIDRQLPFLCVYRRPTRRADAGTVRLVTSEASYLTCSAHKALQPGIAELVKAVTAIMVEQFGGCLVLEMWAGPALESQGPVTTAELTPRLRIVAPRVLMRGSKIDDFEEALGRVELGRRRAAVSTAVRSRCAPPGMAPILSAEDAARIGCYLYGLEIAPIYRDPVSGELFPKVLRDLRRGLTVALRRSFFEFSRAHTTHHPTHFHALGRRAVVRAVWQVDRMLADTSERFDFLLQVTPVNTEAAWHKFERQHYERQPVFHYRPLPADPVVLKRDLYRAPVERIEDPALAIVFREKLEYVDRQITMLQDRNTRRFLHESIQVFGGVEDNLHALAVDILERIPARSREGPKAGQLRAQAFAQRARDEIEYFKLMQPGIDAKVEVRTDVVGLLVSRGNLLVSARTQIPLGRVEALIQHEVGTHLLTYHNGRAQRLRQLHAGFAGYDALQEGLAVLAEYLVGGLSRPRLRLLAGRVVAVRAMIEGASFVDTFRELDRDYGFARQTAFTVAMRTYRGGGLTKDAVYLRGLCQILEYLAGGGELEPLFVGKIAVQHIPIIRELRWRGVLDEPPLRPRYVSDPAAMARLGRLSRGASVLDLMEGRKR